MFCPEPVAFAPDIQDVAVVQQPVQYRRGNDSVPQGFAPLTEALVRGQDDAATFVLGLHEGEEGGARLPFVGPDAELVLEWTTPFMEQLPQRGSVPQTGVFHTPRLWNGTGHLSWTLRKS